MSDNNKKYLSAGGMAMSALFGVLFAISLGRNTNLVMDNWDEMDTTGVKIAAVALLAIQVAVLGYISHRFNKYCKDFNKIRDKENNQNNER